MRITIIAIGSRGDVQPYVALGAGLQSIGRVRVVAQAAFEQLVREHGLEFWPLASSPNRTINSPSGREWVHKNQNPVMSVRALLRVSTSVAHRVTAECLDACEGTAAIVANPLGQLAGQHIAEKLRVPLVPALYCPMSPTRAFPADQRFLPWGVRLGGTYNLVTHLVARRLVWLLYRPVTNAIRREVLGLPPLPLNDPLREQELVLYGFSQAVVPRPRDWDDHLQITGYWFLEPQRSWRPNCELAGFLAAGPPPVYVGFGSMASADARRLNEVAVAALEQAGQRGILAGGPGGTSPRRVTSNILTVGDAPHEWLFERVAAVVHHGGAGTTAAGLRADKPTVICPVFADQPFWGARVHELGAGPAPIPFQKLTSASLTGAICRATGNPSMQQRAAQLGRRIRAEDGVARAVEAVSRYVR